MIKTVITVCDYGDIEGGAAKVAIEGAITLASQVEESILFCAVGGSIEKMKSKGVILISLNQADILHEKNRFKAALQGVWNLKAEKKFKELLLNKNPRETVIHIHSWTKALSSVIFKVSEMLGFKVVLTIHDYFLACPNGGFYNYQKRKICELTPLSLKCISCNCDNRKYMHKLWRICRQIVQNGIIHKRKNISYIYISDFSQNILQPILRTTSNYRVNNPVQVKERVKVAAERNDIYLYIGRLSEEKGVKMFCEVVTHLEVKAVIVGDGYLFNELKTDYPNIDFVGWQNYDGVRSYILKARCLVFPSRWYEGSPLTIPEAQAFGIPCVVSDCCAGRNFTNSKLLFNPNDATELSSILKNIQNNKFVEVLSNEAYKNFDINCYDLNSYIENILKIYESAL